MTASGRSSATPWWDAGPIPRTRRAAAGFALLAALGLGLLPGAGPVSALAQEYPERPLVMVCAFAPGGSTDTLARLMAGYLQEELGQPVVVENRPGGGALLAHAYFMQQPADGYTLLTTVGMPYLAVNTLTQGAEFKISDFEFINLPRKDYTLITAGKDSPYGSIADLVKYIRENPGELVVGIGPPGSADYINMTLMLQSLGLTEDDIRIVTYDGGNPLRLALLGGHVDVIFVSGQASLEQADQLKPLMLFRDERVDGWDAPAFAEAMTSLGAEGKFIPGSLGGFAVHAGFKSEHPEEYAKLVAAFEKIFADPERIAQLQQNEFETDWLGPDRSTAMMVEAGNVLENYADLLVAQ